MSSLPYRPHRGVGAVLLAAGILVSGEYHSHHPALNRYFGPLLKLCCVMQSKPSSDQSPGGEGL
jgi:hypothetical protein